MWSAEEDSGKIINESQVVDVHTQVPIVNDFDHSSLSSCWSISAASDRDRCQSSVSSKKEYPVLDYSCTLMPCLTIGTPYLGR
jgi:hypothetical protein